MDEPPEVIVTRLEAENAWMVVVNVAGKNVSVYKRDDDNNIIQLKPLGTVMKGKKPAKAQAKSEALPRRHLSLATIDGKLV